MQELTRDIKKTEVYGYEAEDGTFFDKKEECQKYEESARMVCYGKAKQYLIGKTTEYNLLEFGDSDCGIEIFNVPDMEAAKVIEQYIILQCDDSEIHIGQVTSRIGKEVMACWSYDRDSCWVMTFDEYVDMIQKKYQKITKKEEK